MLIIYNTETKRVERVSLSRAVMPTCALVCPYHTPAHTEGCPECQNCFSVPDDEQIVHNWYLYKVNDDVPDNKYLVKEPKFRLRLMCTNKTLFATGPEPEYHISIDDPEPAEIRVEVVIEGGDLYAITDTLEINATNGILSDLLLPIKGSSTNFFFTPPQATVPVWIKVYLRDTLRRRYHHGSLKFLVLPS